MMPFTLEMPAKCAKVLYDPKKRRYRVLYGGRGSAKSWSVARYILIRAASEKIRVLCTREIQNSIKDSVYKLLVEQIEALGLDDYFIISADRIESRTGSEIIFKGIARNTTGIRSTEGIDICWVEEAEALSAESWRVLTPTIRKEESIIIVTFNPDDERAATYERFIAKFDEKTGTFKPIENPRVCKEFVNYWDNPWFPDVLREDMEWDRINDPELYEHVWCGRPKKYGHAVIFKDKLEIRDFETPDGVQFHFGNDFGSPSGDPNALVRMFIMEGCLFIDHEAHGHVELDELHGFFETVPGSHQWEITADNARPETISFLKSEHVDNNGVCHDGFIISACEKGKGSVDDGIAFLKKFKKIVIHPRCVGTIRDFQNYRWRIDKITGKILPIPVDLSNHGPDACLSPETKIMTINGPIEIRNIKKGDIVLTRSGFFPVKRCWISRRNAEVVDIKTHNGNHLSCTPDHKILTSSGFVRADMIRYGIEEVLTIWRDTCKKQRCKNTMGKHIEDIRRQKAQVRGRILKINANIFTGANGKTRTGKYQKGSISTTKTESLRIILSKILNASAQKNIRKNTSPKNGENFSGTISTRFGTLLLHGTNQKRGERSIKSSAGNHICSEKNRFVGAIAAARNIFFGNRACQDSVQIPVNLNSVVEKNLMTEKQVALFAESLSSVTNTENLKPVPSVVERSLFTRIEKEVWDIEVDGPPEFFANGILVHNCRYGLESWMKGGATIFDIDY